MKMARRRKRRKNYTVFYAVSAVIIVIALSVSIVAVVASFGKDSGGESSSSEQQVQAPVSNVESSEIEISSQEPEESSSSEPEETNLISNNRLPNGDYIEYTADGAAELDQWYLKLANKWNPAGADFIPENLVRINNEGYMFDSRAYGAYKDLTAAAWEEGVNVYAISAYRSYERQQTLFKNRVDRCIREDGLSQEEAIEKAGTIVAVPGTSEHQVGLAIDFNSVEQSFESTKAGKWLAENCWDYGFILRYPTDKTELTGIIYEPWHFRFVGVKHAKKMKELNMCLEEYVEYLKAQ